MKNYLNPILINRSLKEDKMKLLAYIVAIAGLAIIALSNTISKLSFLAGNTKGLMYTVLAGVVLIVIGVVLIASNSKSSSSSKVPHVSEEVPIYEGEGKKRRIIGYKKAS